MNERKKDEHPPFWKSVRNYFREYCNTTSIHGFRYFGEKRTYFERFWWLIVFSITLAFCVYAIHEVYQKWLLSPVIVSFATRETPIYSIPFPAVTICMETKSRAKYYNNTEMLGKFIRGENLTDDEQRLVDYMGMVCDHNYDKHYSDTETFGEELFDNLEKVSPYNPIFKFLFLGKSKHSFERILTEEGICYTFNILDRSEIFRSNVKHYKNYHTGPFLTNGTWSIENGYSENAGLYPYPLRALLAGAKNSLDITLATLREDIDHTCKSSLQGFRVPLDEVVLATVYPSMMTTSDSVKKYSPNKRQCYFQSERYLKYFKLYTSNNCKLECLTNHTLFLCGCVNIFMPRHNNTPICGTGNLGCMALAEKVSEIVGLRRKIILKKRRNLGKVKYDGPIQQSTPPYCNCMPLCSDLSYDAVTSQNPYDRNHFFKAISSSLNGSMDYPENEIHFTRLIIFFKASQFITSQRHELYGPTDFLANFGGLLGLFTGFSILSLMEAIYFLTIRLCCNSRLYGYWAGPNNS